ncbi:MAG: type II toxin-antitoxin system RelE/ParE family toxin [Rhodospirillales bacterium]|nr:type II toxin-antitoxin system RelE/ParE family toxin [Rhodospirillales bacterium]
MSWIVETLDKRVDREINDLPTDIQADLIHVAELIEKHGPVSVGMPHVRHIRGRLWEIRARGKSGHGRGIYVTVKDRRVIILVAFFKKTRTTPKNFIDLALSRAKESGL